MPRGQIPHNSLQGSDPRRTPSLIESQVGFEGAHMGMGLGNHPAPPFQQRVLAFAHLHPRTWVQTHTHQAPDLLHPGRQPLLKPGHLRSVAGGREWERPSVPDRNRERFGTRRSCKPGRDEPRRVATSAIRPGGECPTHCRAASDRIRAGAVGPRKTRALQYWTAAAPRSRKAW